MPSTPIIEAIAAHKQWLETLESAAKQCGQDKCVDAYAQLVHKKSCIFGQWLASEAATEIIDRNAYEQIVVIHEMMHNSAKQALPAVASFNEQQVESALQRVKLFSAQLIRQLEEASANFSSRL